MKSAEILNYKSMINDVIISSGDSLIFYDKKENIWQPKDKREAGRELQRLLAEKTTKRLTSGELKQLYEEIMYDPDFNRPLGYANVNLVNCANGVIDLDTMCKVEPDKDQYFRVKLDFEYKDNVEINVFMTFFNFVKFALGLPDNLDSREFIRHPSVKRLLEMLGYMVSNEYRAKKLLVILGPANSGKSQILELLRRVIGYDNTTSLTLDDITGKGSGRFRTELLMKAHALINDELPTAGVKHLGELKKVIAGEPITVEAKGDRPKTIRNRTKLMFAGNQLPDLAEADCGGAFTSRLCVTVFKNSPSKDQKDVDLIDKLFEERSVIFSLALKAFHNLRKNKLIFTDETVADTLIETYRENTSSVMSFVNDECIKGHDKSVYKLNLYDNYCRYCQDNALYAMNRKEFTQQLLSIPEVEKIGKARLHGDKISRSTVFGIGLKKELEKE